MSGGQNNSRQTQMIYPNGRTIDDVYNTGLDSTISRLSAIADDSGGSPGTTLEGYSYLGLDTIVQYAHPQDGVNLTYIQQTGETNLITDGGDQYVGLDRFGRVIGQNWWNPTTETSTDRFQYGYDRDGDVLYSNNLVNSVESELYRPNSTTGGDSNAAYDPLGRETAFARGTLTASGHNGSQLDTIASPSAAQSYNLDAVGNSLGITTNGSTTTQTFSAQNETTSESGDTTPTYNNDGDTTGDDGLTYVYDAWDRLVAVEDGSATLATYAYDALGRRITLTEATPSQPAASPQPGDAGFESPSVGSGFVYAPGGTPWTYSVTAGVAGNGSGFTSSNPPAPEGAQVLLLQETGSVSQSVAGWAAGTYAISFYSAQRGSHQASQQDFEVEIDGTVVGTFTPSSTSYAVYTTSAFTLTAGSHTITFIGLDSATGDNTALVDDVQIVAATPQPGDAGFESPSVGSGFAYRPSGTPWTFSGTAGVAGNGSGFTSSNPPAPEGAQVLLLQETGSVSQSVAGWAAGTYAISFDSAQRGSHQASQQDFEVEIDGTVVGTFTPSSASYAVYTTSAFTVTAGSHTIEFIGLDTATGDNTALVDDVQVTQVTTDHLYYSADDQVIEERVGGTASSNVAYQYVWGAGYVNELVLRDTYSGGVEQASKRLYAQWDANYNVTALVNTSGVVQERYLYDPYGSVTVINASWTPVAGNTSSFNWRYLFQGGRLDTVTGWYDFQNRDLIPSQGTWAERDPLGFGGGELDLYGYESDSPADGSDPSGLSDEWPLWEGTKAFGSWAGTGLANIGTGAFHTVYDVGAVPVDFVGTVASNNWTPVSYYGSASLTAQQNGTPVWQISGETALNVGTLGGYGYGKGAYNYAQTGDPTEWQQSSGGIAVTVIAPYGMGKLAGVGRTPLRATTPATPRLSNGGRLVNNPSRPGIRCVRPDSAGGASESNPFNLFNKVPPEQPTFDPSGTLGAAKVWSSKGRLKNAQLPTSGKVRYIPPKGYSPGQPLPRGPQKGFIDRFGNEWTHGPSRTAGQSFEWDVQLGKNATNGVKWASPDGKHLNVSLDGEVTH